MLLNMLLYICLYMLFIYYIGFYIYLYIIDVIKYVIIYVIIRVIIDIIIYVISTARIERGMLEYLQERCVPTLHCSASPPWSPFLSGTRRRLQETQHGVRRRVHVGESTTTDSPLQTGTHFPRLKNLECSSFVKQMSDAVGVLRGFRKITMRRI